MRPHVAVLLGVIVLGACTAGEDITPQGALRDAGTDRAVGTGGSTHAGGGTASGGTTGTGGTRADSSIPSDAASGGAGGATAAGGATGTGGATAAGGATGTGGAPSDASADGPPVEAGSCTSVAVCNNGDWPNMFKDYRCSIGQLVWTCTTDCRNCGSDPRCCAPQQTGCPWAGVTWASSPCN
jgi:hypothetical protein